MSTPTTSDSLAEQLRKFSPSPNRDPDAGLRAVHHYERRLPKWRYRLRQWLIPIVRWETPYLARLQEAVRTPVLDSYFAFTANLGTHTFFMMFLPVCFWFGYADFGIALVHMLALGVYLSGFLKDLVCLPRPLSPPLQRITMSGSAALEYGFPSTHTTNAVSVALFSLYQLYLCSDQLSPLSYRVLCGACYFYAASITLGRMYCGMHGFFDLQVGFILGAFIAWLRVAFGPSCDMWIIADGWSRPAIAVLVLALAVRFHPEPADNCPCFDDSVAFIGVVMGIAIGVWHYARLQENFVAGAKDLSPFYAYTNQSILIALARLLGGIVVIFMWRAVMKPFLLRTLPPTFRFIDHWGLMIPRRYFKQARDYTLVPELRKDDNVIPAASEIPSMLSAFRNPRKRRVSVGPQSEADAREYLASREQRRRNRAASSPKRRPMQKSTGADIEGDADAPSPLPDGSVRSNTISPDLLQVSTGNSSLLTPPISETGASSDSGREDEKRDREMFSAVEKPRTHYDVEVITKLVVYAGKLYSRVITVICFANVS